MKTLKWTALALTPLALFACSDAMETTEDPDAMLIASAMSAAPPGVAANATIVAPAEDGSMRVLREGTNNFTCMPDDPGPGNNPMCLDKNGVEWAMAWINKTTPPAGKVGFGYMLAGGGTASNVDPYATEPPDGGPMPVEPSHVMIFNLPGGSPDYPRPDEDYDGTQPWVMWKDTPYEHLMIPIE
jgi:hypothetical protein